MSALLPARFTLVALDEGVEPDEGLDPSLAERLAFRLDLHPVAVRDVDEPRFPAHTVEAARASCGKVTCGADMLEKLCAAGVLLGVDSPRANLFALRAARAAAALAGRPQVTDEEFEIALRLVLAPRATRLPAADTQEEESAEQAPPESGEDGDQRQSGEGMEDRLIEAVTAALPAGLLAALAQAGLANRSSQGGKSGQRRRSKLRGRPMGTTPGDPRSGARLSPVATLRAAAPWQTLRRREETAREGMILRRDDFRVVRFRERSESTTVFVVDASGSAALNRLAEAKGAVELLLADCYTRRDQVALVAFRGEQAEVLLPPTRSLVRAKRNLAALPGGGGTPLASAVETAAVMADYLQRRGSTPAVIFLTDGRGNIGRDGSRGREAAAADLESAAALFRSAGVRGMVIDTSPRPGPGAEALARSLDLTYLPLPHADAARLRDAVRHAAP